MKKNYFQKKYHTYKFKNLTLLFLSVVFSIFLFQSDMVKNYIIQILSISHYLGLLISGVLFVSTITASFAVLILTLIHDQFNFMEIIVIASLGTVVGDLIIFKIIRNHGIIDEIKHLFKYFGSYELGKLLKTPYFNWTLPVLGALIIASPLPDELGISLLSLSRLNLIQFSFVSFVLNSIGITSVLAAISLLS